MRSGPVLTFGETMGLVRTLEVGDLADVSDARLGTGGADSNVAIGLARLGVPVVWVGRVGADGFGRRIVRDLRAEGVDVRAVVDERAPTGIMVKAKRTPHTTNVVFYRDASAGSRLEPSDVAEELVQESAHVHVSGVTAGLSSTALATVRGAVDAARRCGIPVSFDINHRPSVWAGRDAAAVYREIAAGSDVVFAGADEAALLVGEGEPGEQARRIAALGPSTVVIKRGERGSLGIADGGPLVEQAAMRVPVVDSVGAGDAFVAGFLAARSDGQELPASLALASAAGAFACMGPGDWESLPRRGELGLLENNDPVTR